MKKEQKVYMVFADGRRVYCQEAENKRQALKDAKEWLRAFGDNLKGVNWEVIKWDGRVLW